MAENDHSSSGIPTYMKTTRSTSWTGRFVTLSIAASVALASACGGDSTGPVQGPPSLTVVNGVPHPTGLVGMTVAIEGTNFGSAAQGKVFFTPENQARLGDRSRLLVGTRLTWSLMDGTVEVAGWVRNVTGSVYRLTAINLIGVLSQIDYVMSEPRTYGITGTFKF